MTELHKDIDIQIFRYWFFGKSFCITVNHDFSEDAPTCYSLLGKGKYDVQLFIEGEVSLY